MPHPKKIAIILTVVAVGAMARSVVVAQVTGSKHDLSTPGGSASEGPCIYCHTPHGANTSIGAPLWNRVIDQVPFQMYSSQTSDVKCEGQPSSYTLACLGCHDGVVAYDTVSSPFGVPVSTKHDVLVVNGRQDLTTWPNCARCHPEFYSGGSPIKWIGAGAGAESGGGQDLRNDHPISIPYPTSAQDPDFRPPTDLIKGFTDLPFFVSSGVARIECATCHAVHNPSIKPFLRKSNANDALCKTCHIK